MDKAVRITIGITGGVLITKTIITMYQLYEVFKLMQGA